MISDIQPVNNYAGNGSSTTFDFDFCIDNTNELNVYHISQDGTFTLLTKDLDYSVNEFTTDNSRVTPDFSEGGYIVFPLQTSSYSVLSTNEKISLQLTLPFVQESDYDNSSLLNLGSLEFSLDYLTRLCQILKRNLDRCAKIKEGSTLSVEELVDNINTLADDKNNIDAVANDLTNINSVADDLENIDSVAGSISDINSVASSISDVNSVASSISDINSVADDLTNIDNVAGDLTNIDSVASDLTNIDAVNSNKTNIDTVSGSISDINSVASSISDVNSVASDLTNIDSVASDLTNIDAVNSNKTNIDTVSGSISDINSVASSISDVNSVASDLTNIDSVAGDLTNIDSVAGDLTNINSVAGDLTNIDSVAGDLENINNASQYADLSHDWAVKMDGKINNEDYSAKYYAQQAAQGQLQSDWNQTDNTAKDYIKNKPTIPDAQIQSDWNQTDNTAKDYIKNKPTIPTAGANTDLSNLTATGEAHFLKNRSTGVNSISIGNGNSASGAINIGDLSTCGEYSIAIGGYNNGYCSIMLGNGYSSNVNYSFDVGVNDYNSYDRIGRVTYQMLDLKTGLIPDARLSTNIARTSQIPSTSGLANTSLSNLSSTGQKVIDGQWVAKETSLTTSTAINTYTLDLINYLPVGGGKYEVLVACNITSNNTSPSNTRLYSDIISISTNYLNQKTPNTSHSLQAGCLLILPVTRYLYFKIENHATASTTITAVGYRRIGTNT